MHRPLAAGVERVDIGAMFERAMAIEPSSVTRNPETLQPARPPDAAIIKALV